MSKRALSCVRENRTCVIPKVLAEESWAAGKDPSRSFGMTSWRHNDQQARHFDRREKSPKSDKDLSHTFKMTERLSFRRRRPRNLVRQKKIPHVRSGWHAGFIIINKHVISSKGKNLQSQIKISHMHSRWQSDCHSVRVLNGEKDSLNFFDVEARR